MNHARPALQVCAAATHDPFDPRTFSGLSRHLFLALIRAGATIAPLRTRHIGATDALTGALDPRPLLRGHRPRVRPSWQWSSDVCERLSERASDAVADQTCDAILQVGTHVIIDHPKAVRACITDATVVQAIAAGEFSVARSRRIDDAIAWQHDVFTSMDRIFTLSAWAARSVIDDYGIDPARVVVTGAGANLDPPLPHQPDTAPLVLFVGRDWEQKGGPAILDAWRLARRHVPDLELAIVGCSPAIDEPGVHVVGTLHRDVPAEYAELRALYARARMFVLCSRFDAFPNVLLEAQWSGVPVIAYDEASRPEAVRDGKTGFLVPRDEPLALAAAITTLAQNAVTAHAMGRAAQQFIEHTFTWPVVADRILTALSDAQRTRTPARLRTHS